MRLSNSTLTSTLITIHSSEEQVQLFANMKLTIGSPVIKKLCNSWIKGQIDQLIFMSIVKRILPSITQIRILPFMNYAARWIKRNRVTLCLSTHVRMKIEEFSKARQTFYKL